MERFINYDFDYMIECCRKILTSNTIKPSNTIIEDLRKEINHFFKDSRCKEIIYTNNTSMFFGMSVYPIVDEKLINSILQDDENVRFNIYTIEIDSKLTSPILDLTPREFVAILLHEIGHIINDSNPVEDARNALALELAKNGESLNVPKSIQYMQILSFGIKDTIHKMNSMFYTYKNGEVLADEFVYMCRFADELNSAFTKICKSGMKINSEVNRLTALSWSLNLYKNVKLKRIPALRLIRKMKSITSSEIEKRELKNIERALNIIDDSGSIQEYYNLDNKSHYYVLTESNDKLEKKSKYAELRKIAAMKYIAPFKDEVYEYAMRSRHISDQNDALYLMRQINLRISVIEDFIDSTELNEWQLQMWWGVLSKYYKIRDNLANKVNYRYDYSGSVIQVNYPDIVPNRM